MKAGFEKAEQEILCNLLKQLYNAFIDDENSENAIRRFENGIAVYRRWKSVVEKAIADEMV